MLTKAVILATNSLYPYPSTAVSIYDSSFADLFVSEEFPHFFKDFMFHILELTFENAYLLLFFLVAVVRHLSKWPVHPPQLLSH